MWKPAPPGSLMPLLDQWELWKQVRPSTSTLPGAQALIHAAHFSAGLAEASFMETMPKNGQCHLMKLLAHFSGELPALMNPLPQSCLPSQGDGDPASFAVGGRAGRAAGGAGRAEGWKESSSGQLGLEWECLWPP